MSTTSNQGEAFEKVPPGSLSLEEEEEGEEDEAEEESDIVDIASIKTVKCALIFMQQGLQPTPSKLIKN
ncbi:hypothetical protein OnM2_031049 [Erysiphe neolycopersici]|uniref:Uncharacterized protein n=1 Tax=Erysiphe neolycopersici TaxID=212602 RepID=A0A420HZ50_9PEZI|nr:hypothetical protein OnM2_031049 [Erysiphe neolycopersici]